MTSPLLANLRAFGIIGAGIGLVLFGATFVVVGAMSMGSVEVSRVPMAGGGLLFLGGMGLLIGGVRAWLGRRQLRSENLLRGP